MTTNFYASKIGNASKPSCNFVRILGLIFAVLVFVGSFLVLKLGWFMGGGSSRNDMQAPQIVAAQARHTATLIFLHGLGDTGHSWAEFLRELKLKNIRCVCPTAHTIPVTLNGMMRMPSWFDIMGLSLEAEEDEPGIKKASDMLKHLIEEEEKLGIPSNRIILGGFSQGGAVALYTGFTVNKPLGGVVALSSWIPLFKTLPQHVSSHVKNMPVFQGHGTADPIVNIVWGRKTHDLIQKFSEKCAFEHYDGMGHSTCPSEMKDVRNFLESTFPPEK